MGIGPIEFNGMNIRTPELQAFKVHEDQKVIFDNQNFGQQVQKNVDSNVNDVHTKDDTEFTHSDNNKNKNEYAGDGGRNRKQQNQKDGHDKILNKDHHSFDIKI